MEKTKNKPISGMRPFGNIVLDIPRKGKPRDKDISVDNNKR